MNARVDPPPSFPFISPMKAVIGSLHPAIADWAVELKWDGMRLQLHLGSGGSLRAFSASGRVVTAMAPELALLPDQVPVPCVLDGELVSFEHDRPSFALLQQRIHVTDPTPTLIERAPVVFLAFDVLAADGHDTTHLGYTERRRLLTQLLEDGPSWRTPPHGQANAAQLLELAERRGLEGIVVKRPDSRYRPGQRTPDWVKVKIRKRHEFVVGGWLEGTGGLRGHIGSLLLGVYDNGELHFAGTAGSGIADADRRRLEGALRPAGNPFARALPATTTGAHFVEPSVVVEIEFSLWPMGGVLWHPVFRGIRTDRAPETVEREFPPDPPAS